MNTQPGTKPSGQGRDSLGTRAPAEIARLKRRGDFLRVAATRRRAAMPGLVLQVADSPPDSRAALRLGFTASRKVGGAVARNRARRRLREAVRSVMPLNAGHQRDYVVIARKGTLDRKFEDLRTDLEKALKRLDAWRGSA